MLKGKIKKILGRSFITTGLSFFHGPTVLVLMYHDLRQHNDSQSWLRIYSNDFEDQLNKLSSIGDFISPTDLDRIFYEKSKQLYFMVTFDDGYINNYRLAFPILKKLNIPALFFISTERINQKDLFWFDWIILPIQKLELTELDLTEFGLKNYNFTNENNSRRWDDIQLLLEDVKVLGNQTDDIVQNIIAFFKEKFFGSIKEVLPFYRPLEAREIREMYQSGLCHFGSHSHTHEILTLLNTEKALENLSHSKHILEKLLECEINYISYPNGNWNEKIIKMCQDIGFQYGFLAQSGLFKNNTNRMRIPRMGIGGYDTPNDISFSLNKMLLQI